MNVALECHSIECNSHETHKRYSNFNDRQQFRLSKINEIKYYFFAEINEWKTYYFKDQNIIPINVIGLEVQYIFIMIFLFLYYDLDY